MTHDFIETKDGTRIFYKDWGSGRPIVFSHGWPQSSDAWDAQMLFFGQQGFRVIAHDRRGHGRSAQPWDGNNIDRFADDLADLLETLGLENVILVGHSIGGAEIARYIGRHGNGRVAKAVLVGAPLPLMARTADNPDGVPLEVFDGIRKGVAENRLQYFKDVAIPFYGFNRDGIVLNEGIRDAFWLQSTFAGIRSLYDSVREFSEVDYTEDLKKIEVPTLIIHGDDDQMVPAALSAERAVKIIRNATLNIYQGGGHGLPLTEAGKFNADVLAFITS
ncbi:alpha/beta hydrolase [Rhizobium sp. S95]|uniref:Alpha/beta hydrolase n=1 Tax=Ciceribacter sichuanensis TaxID=2949647 RepID=A0AAJ1F8J2_9HYPH|nr:MULTISPECIES: alpha/beta hydrolase [unclassified Ciceribacter]MCM2397333.1 alpha/beta hydrolase [Ciceribacter sp. S95]MCO5959017.1 alpha/beta hydrolase [Ciceribacter sp. S101]